MNKKSIRTLSSLALAVAAASSGAYGAQLEEIIVTAQKRAEKMYVWNGDVLYIHINNDIVE